MNEEKKTQKLFTIDRIGYVCIVQSRLNWFSFPRRFDAGAAAVAVAVTEWSVQ